MRIEVTRYRPVLTTETFFRLAIDGDYVALIKQVDYEGGLIWWLSSCDHLGHPRDFGGPGTGIANSIGGVIDGVLQAIKEQTERFDDVVAMTEDLIEGNKRREEMANARTIEIRTS